MEQGHHASPDGQKSWFRAVWIQLARYCISDLDANERTNLERWIARDPRRAVLVKQMRQVWTSSDPVALADVETALASMHNRLGIEARRALTAEQVHAEAGPRALAADERFLSNTRPTWDKPRILRVQPQRQRRWIAMGVGVATSLVVIASVTILRQSKTAPSQAAATYTYRTHVGQQANVTLPDGSRAMLGPATTMRVVATPAHSTVVSVDGEALFVVTHRTQVPFTVQTRTTQARVLGTQFDVRHYASDPVTRVAVVEGRVTVRSTQHPQENNVVLTAQMIGTVDDSGHVQVTPSDAIEDYTAWATGRLVFRQTPARDVVADLGRAYGVEISLPDSVLGRRTLTWSLPVTHVTLAGALDVLTTFLQAHVVQSGKSITIMPGRTNSAQRRGADSLYRREHTYGR